MVVVPAEVPVTTPVVSTAVATSTLLLLHVPPVVALASEVDEPIHACVLPVIGAGVTFIVNVAVDAHPVVTV
jgi:hypothetical protein